MFRLSEHSNLQKSKIYIYEKRNKKDDEPYTCIYIHALLL